LAPSTVKLKAASPAFTAAGASAVTAGAGLLAAGGDAAPVPDVVAVVDVATVGVVAVGVVALDVVAGIVADTGVLDPVCGVEEPAAVAAPPAADCTSTPPQPESIVSTPQAAKNRGRSTEKVLSRRCHVVAA
jgi:hypothetical protein